jgi:hypothetical protein
MANNRKSILAQQKIGAIATIIRRKRSVVEEAKALAA